MSDHRSGSSALWETHFRVQQPQKQRKRPPASPSTVSEEPAISRLRKDRERVDDQSCGAVWAVA